MKEEKGRYNMGADTQGKLAPTALVNAMTIFFKLIRYNGGIGR